MNKKGMTLIELLVYMAIAALLLTPVIMLMQNSSLNMARNAVNTDLRMSGRDILNIMYEDLRNTGFKLNNMAKEDSATYIAIESTPPLVPPQTKVFDSSSFMSGNGTANVLYDTLTIRKGVLDNNGNWAGYDSVTYYVDDISNNKILTRKAVRRNGTSPASIPAGTGTQQLVGNLEALQFQYSKDLITWEDSYGRTSVFLLAKREAKYIKIVLVLKDPKQLSPLRTAPAVEVVEGVAVTPELGDQALRERHEIVVPIPNNGLFPP